MSLSELKADSLDNNDSRTVLKIARNEKNGP